MILSFRLKNVNPKLKPAIRITISHVTRGSNPSMNGNADFTGCAENEININLGEYGGDLSEAQERIQAFCNQHEVKYQGLGLGYANLYIDGNIQELNPYHVDIKMMLAIVDKHSAESTIQSRSDVQRISNKFN